MVVYWEYAFLENFLLDGLLLYLSLRVSRQRVRPLRLCLAAALGGGEALVFPLLALPVWCAYLVKVLGGALIVAVAAAGKRVKPCLAATAAFFAFTFALGGLMTAAYSFFGVEYAEGNGFLVERAPVGLVFALAGGFFAAALEGVRALFRFRRVQSRIADCTLKQGERTVRWRALCDSGNLLEFRGKGVCVCSAAAIFALMGKDVKAAGRISVFTVNGERERPVFECEALCVEGLPPQRAYLTVGEVSSKRYTLLLHTAYLEGKHETACSAEGVA